MRNQKKFLVATGFFLVACLNSLATPQLFRFHHLNDFTASSQFADPPTLTAKSSETVDNINVFTYSVSYMNADVVKALNDLKNLHKPGGSIAFELSPFEIDEANLTIKVGIEKSILDQKGLLDYLQKKLNYAFGKLELL